MITLLIALHPKSWRARYGEEFRALLESQPLTVMVVLNVLGNAGRQHVGAHRTLLRVTLALAVSVGVEWMAVTRGFADNILWPPDTGPRAALLATLVLTWVPLGVDLFEATRRRLHGRHRA